MEHHGTKSAMKLPKEVGLIFGRYFMESIIYLLWVKTSDAHGMKGNLGFCGGIL